VSRLPWVLWGLFAVTAAACAGLVFAESGDQDEALAGVFAGYATVGALITSRQPRNTVGWLLMAIALAFVVESLADAYVASSATFAREYVGWLAGWLTYVWMAILAVFLPLVFPTGRLLGPRWRPVAWLGGGALVATIAGVAFKPGDLNLSAPVDNPLGVRAAEDVVAASWVLGNVLVLIAFVLACASLVLRFRRAHGVEREQIKWFALVGLLVTAALLLAMFEVLFPGGWRLAVGTVGWNAFLVLAILGVPAAVGIAILRHGLYDIDVVIRRTLVYSALTATLAAGYLICVLLTQLVIGADSSLTVAVSTLAMAALFRPALARIQALVDRRFYRRRYDARQTLEQFGSRLRDELDLEALGSDLRGVVRDTMQPAHVSLWLRGTPR
jgi:hypothetical protein